MSEQVFGLGVNQVMAYAAVANVLLVIVLAGINVYYAVHAKRQADASRDQVAVLPGRPKLRRNSLVSAQAVGPASPDGRGGGDPAAKGRYPRN